MSYDGRGGACEISRAFIDCTKCFNDPFPLRPEQFYTCDPPQVVNSTGDDSGGCTQVWGEGKQLYR